MLLFATLTLVNFKTLGTFRSFEIVRINHSTMTKKALVVVDLQEDFLPPSGSLAIANGRSVVEPIIKLISDPYVKQWSLVIATQDWHPSNHTSFASQHGVEPFTELDFEHPESGRVKKQFVWPIHCVQGSTGAELESKFSKAFGEIDGVPTANVKKGYLQDREYYSCFQDTWGLHHTEMKQVLLDNAIDEVVFVGLAFDYCVLNSAIDSAKSFKTYVVKSLSKSVSPENDSKTEQLYKDAGVIVVDDISDIIQS
ncbi:PNC1 [Candida margitis]|uniref:PNC1 n=1 Tax=Candida margitis TaxID=1775924 RepID=UPI002226AE1E|nr:PNC1 [Candida margitis]KAI5970118.1 PNC1 [Candida margitis]